MRQILLAFILLGVGLSGLSQARCFTYDAAGNRTTRIACAASIPQNDGKDEMVANLASAVADDIGGSISAVRSQLLANDVSPLVIFPNPSSGVFHLDATLEKDAKLIIYDGNGKAVWTRDSVPDQIDLMHLDNGNYYLVISESSGVRSAMLIISK